MLLVKHYTSFHLSVYSVRVFYVAAHIKVNLRISDFLKLTLSK